MSKNIQTVRLLQSDPLANTRYLKSTIKDISSPYRNLKIDGIDQSELNVGELILISGQENPTINGVYRISKLHDNVKNKPFILKKVKSTDKAQFIVSVVEGTKSGSTWLCSFRDDDICVVAPFTAASYESKQVVVKRKRNSAKIETVSEKKDGLILVKSDSIVAIPAMQKHVRNDGELMTLQEEIDMMNTELLNVKHADKLREELESTKKLLHANELSIKSLANASSDKQKELNDKLEIKKNEEARVSNLNAQLAKLDGELGNLRNISELENSLDEKKKLLESLNRKIKTLLDAGDLKKSIDSHNDIISSKKKRLDGLLREVIDEESTSDLKVEDRKPEARVEELKSEELKSEELKSEELKSEELKSEELKSVKTEKPKKKKKGLGALFAKLTKTDKKKNVVEKDNVPDSQVPMLELEPVVPVVMEPAAELTVITQAKGVNSYSDFVQPTMTVEYNHLESMLPPISYTPSDTQNEAFPEIEPKKVNDKKILLKANLVRKHKGCIPSINTFYKCTLVLEHSESADVDFSNDVILTRIGDYELTATYTGLNLIVKLQLVSLGQPNKILQATSGVPVVCTINKLTTIHCYVYPKLNGKPYDISDLTLEISKL